MEPKIIEDKDNLLLNRREIYFEVVSEKTPTKLEIGNFISEKFSVQEGNISIKKIQGRFGSKNFKITVHIYGTVEDKEKTILKKKEVKKG